MEVARTEVVHREVAVVVPHMAVHKEVAVAHRMAVVEHIALAVSQMTAADMAVVQAGRTDRMVVDLDYSSWMITSRL